MNTTTHPLSTYFLVHDRPHARLAALASFLPDTPYLVALSLGLARHGWTIATALGARVGGDAAAGRRALAAAGDVIWATWADPAANFAAQKVAHNLLFAALFGAVALASRRPAPRAFALGWMLHVWTDLSLHAADAYAVLWPLSSRVFPSPVSYWDGAHHAALVGRLLSAMAAALWIWLARRVRRWPGPPARRRLALGACAAFVLGSALGVVAGSAPAPHASSSWVDDGVVWPPELLPIARMLDAGDARGALDAIRATAIAAADPSAPPRERNAARARQQLLLAYAHDLAGHRADALASYRLAERLEPVGHVGDKARRYSGEPFRNVPDPAVSGPWAALFLVGMTCSGVLLWTARRPGGPYAAAGAGDEGGARSARPPR